MKDRRIGALTKNSDERRFNVAASRARDQLWLFHTATLNDLSRECLRYKLLEYCTNPTVAQTHSAGIDVGRIRHVAATTDRDQTPPPGPFESWFEVDVFLRIIERGYRVIPQYEVAGYRIDLVIEGMKGRVAVECDGDRWHGPERYADDMARQRMLERCGWPFWRLRGSAFALEPDHAMEGLWDVLQRHDVRPGA
jgi:very-short-patch-repair endonuclease